MVVVALPLESAPGADRADVVRELRARIGGLQRTRFEGATLPTHPALAELLPGGGLAAGGVYGASGSTTLALALAQGPSAAGAWCAVVGLPELGLEAAAELGLRLDRLALVPQPGQQWLAVVAALADIVQLVVVRPPAGGRIGEAAAGRLAARLRRRESALVVLGDWPGQTARLEIVERDWIGIGPGFGRISACRAMVRSHSAAWPGHGRVRRLWLPGRDGALAADAAAGPAEQHSPTGRKELGMPAAG